MAQVTNPPLKVEFDSGGDELESVNASGQNTPGGGASTKGKAEDGGVTKKSSRNRKRGPKANGQPGSKRRHSVSKPARDPRDDPSPTRVPPKASGTRSLSPVLDFDGLSHPSMNFHRFLLTLLTIN